MKAIYYQMPLTFVEQNLVLVRMWLATVAAVLVSAASYSQDSLSRVWVTINDPSIINATPASQFDKLMEQQSVETIAVAFPNSHTPALQKVYELGCKCDNTELERLLLTVQGVSKPVAIYDPIMLDTPDDYNMTFTPDYALDLIQAQGAWDITHGNPSVVLGVSDVSFDLTHEELTGKVVAGTVTSTSAAYHGTAVAVTAAGRTNNNVGKSSIGYNCNLGLFIANYNGLLAARDAGIRVVNASWHDGSCAPNSYAQAIINELYEDGVIVVASAGNGAVTCGNAGAMAYPASYPHVISVTSIGPNSNHERTPGDPATAHQHNASVDICAPGYDVPLTVASGWYLTGNGTSFAAPFVTGTIGLMLSVNPDLTVDQVEEIIDATATNIDSLNPNYAGLLGAGKLNAAMAVALSSTLARPQPGTPSVSVNNEPVQDRTEIQGNNQQTAGIESANRQSQPVLYPNPSAGAVYIAYAFQKGQTIEIIDMTGRTEQVIELEGVETNISLADLTKGVHQIALKEAGKVISLQKAVIL